MGVHYAFLFSIGGYTCNLIGGIFMLLGMNLDLSDGMVARLTDKN